MMWIGSLALAGIPFFAGYYSKDLILEAAFADHSWFGNYAFWMGIVAALLTAFYSWRLILMTFHGKPRADEHVMAHVHESPSIMLLPLVILSLGALFAGYVFYGGFVGSAHAPGHINDVHNTNNYVNIWDKEHFWGESIKVLPENDTVEAAHHVPKWVKYLPIGVAGFGIFLAYLFYLWSQGLAAKCAGAFRPIHQLFYNKWYFDELYERVFVQRAKRWGNFFWKKGDGAVIDRMGPDGVSSLSRRIGGVLSLFQSGYMFQYAFIMLVGLLGLITWLIYRMTVGL
jgi:NADH-quinone oxidoreductase subunit L